MNNKPVKKQLKNLKFNLLSPEEIKKLAVAKIVTPELYDVDGYPVDGGLMALRLGAIDPGVRCRTCGGRLKECLGHPGVIELARPVLHIKYLQIIDLVLRSTCEACGDVLLDEKDIAASSGSACTTGSLEPSHVMRAMGLPYVLAHSSIRFSLSIYNTEKEIDTVIEVMPGIVDQLRKLSPYVK